jgi:PAS domain S-box-containing protein
LAGGLLLLFLGGNIALQSQVRAKTKELVKYRDHLAELVQERTAELRAANNQLEREIAGRKLVEETLRESTEKIRAMFESMTDGITFGDLQGNIVDSNEATVRMHEFESKEELIGRSAFEFIAESDQARALETLQKTLATGRSGVIEYKMVTKTGREFDGELSAVLLRDEQGNPSAFVALTRDISERKRAEEALRESEERYSMLFNEMLTGLSLHEIILDDHGKPVDYRFLDVNPAFEKHTGLKKEDLVGRTVLEVLPGTEPIWIETSGEVALGGEPVHFEHYSSEIGKYYEVLTFCPRKGQFATLSSDITERKKIEQELQEYREHLEELVEERAAELKARVAEVEQLNRAMTNVLEDLQAANLRATETARQLQEANAELESFSYSVSHDLRAPLRHIDGFVSLLARHEGERLDETSARYLNVVRESVGKMGQLIEDLLALSRTGRAEMRFQRVELGELVETVRRELELDERERRIDWQIAPLPAVEGDLALLRQVWTNLLSNACKYTTPREEARIEVGTVQGETGGGGEEGQVTLFCRDNGVGFDPQYADKLFGVFQRLHQEGEFEGTGVGLAIVRRIVHRHGGRVWAEGEPDGGATFYLTLKAASEGSARNTGRKQGENSTNPGC